MAQKPTSAIEYISEVNGNPYDEMANPTGLAQGGHRQVFPLALTNTATVANYIADTADEVASDATQTAADRVQTGNDRVAAAQSAAAAATFDPALYGLKDGVPAALDTLKKLANNFSLYGPLDGVPTAYNTLNKIASAMALKSWFPTLSGTISGTFLRVNSAGTAWEARAPTDVRNDISAVARGGLVTGLNSNLNFGRNLISVTLSNGATIRPVMDLSSTGRIAVYYSESGWPVFQIDNTDFAVSSRQYALDVANNAAAGRASKDGDTFFGNVTIRKTGEPRLDLISENVRQWALRALSDGSFDIADISGNRQLAIFQPDGNISFPVMSTTVSGMRDNALLGANAYSAAIRDIRLTAYVAGATTSDAGSGRVLVGANANNNWSRQIQRYSLADGWQNVYSA